MKRFIPGAALALPFLFLASCATEPESKPAGPTSDTGNISWSGQVSPPLQGQLGMLPQNQHRR